MRDNMKRVGLGVLNLLVFLLCIIAVLVLLGRHSRVLAQAVMPLVLLAVYCAGVRWIERRRPVELLDAKGAIEGPLGVGVGIALFAMVMLLLMAAGDYHPQGFGMVQPLTGGALAAVMAATVEELLFRGFLYRLMATLSGTWGALLVTSALFGAAHIFNPSATAASSIAIALEAGVLLGAAYALTRRLWLPIGLHAGWNFAEGSIFGMSVSGTARGRSLIVGGLHGPTILTGGEFGPEASIIAVIVCLTLAVVLLWRTMRLGRVEPPMWRLKITEGSASPVSG